MKKATKFSLLFLGLFNLVVLAATGFLAIWYKGLFADIYVLVVIYLLANLLLLVPTILALIFK